MQSCDLIVVGAGPAGMAAAIEAAAQGLSVLLLDEQARAGGQIYRDVDRVAGLRGDLLGAEYSYGLTLTDSLRQSKITHLHGAVVWLIESGGGHARFEVSCTQQGRARQFSAHCVLLATGALERPMPLPGWTLPGVMTVGAAQILLKQSGVIARRAVLMGSGPLLYLVAAQMVRAGTPPLALIETQSWRDLIRAQRHGVGALRSSAVLLKGLGLLGEITRAGVRRYVGASDIAIEGKNQAEAVTFACKGRQHRIECDTVMLHHGVVPNTQAARSLGVAHQWDVHQHCFVPQCDGWGACDVDGVYVAGDGAGIGGAQAAELAGRVAALGIARMLDKLEQSECNARARPLQRELSRSRAIRPFLDIAYPPYAPALLPDDATMVCRCEAVTAGDIRACANMGCVGPNQTKAFCRAGMGPCQGRYCGLTVTALLADVHARSADQTGYYRIRPPLKPVTLGELATLTQSECEAESATEQGVT